MRVSAMHFQHFKIRFLHPNKLHTQNYKNVFIELLFEPFYLLGQKWQLLKSEKNRKSKFDKKKFRIFFLWMWRMLMSQFMQSNPWVQSYKTLLTKLLNFSIKSIWFCNTCQFYFAIFIILVYFIIENRFFGG